MKHVITSLLLGLSALVYGQGELPPVPASEDVNLRLELASVEMERAADFRDAALYCALFGGAISGIAFSDNATAGRVCAVLTVSAFYGLNLVANGRDRRAARLLHGAQ